jgi:hypothetical protein
MSNNNIVTNNRYASEFKNVDWGKRMATFTKRSFKCVNDPLQELIYGIRAKTLPWNKCFVAGTLIALCISRHWDLAFLKNFHVGILYPTHGRLYWAYRAFFLSSPWLAWALYQLGLRQQLLNRLTEACQNAGLKTLTNRLPAFIYDHAIDSETRKLRLYAVGIPLQHFQRAKPVLQAGLQIFIDDIRDDIRSGTIEIIYAQNPLPESALLENVSLIPAWTFTIGRTRARWLSADLPTIPHLLVAGQTGGGKSTFLRQFITTLYVNNPSCEFLLIDLKGGLEFQLFEGLPRVRVASSTNNAIALLKSESEKVESRMALLKKEKVKDLQAYGKKGTLSRQVIVVDEAAELFLAGGHASASDVQFAKRTLSQIARQGRSVGVHLVIATQRPDSHAVDPQVKANLPGVLCFPMANDASSMTVLGNGRATDLKLIPGRALWKVGAEMTEVQTPYLSPSQAELLLNPFRPVQT